MKSHFALLLLFFIQQIPFAQLPAGFAKFEIAGELNPTDLAIAADGRIFLTEKNGLVHIVKDGILLPDPFVILDVEDYNEQGLGHIALDPAFPAEPFVYLYYTVSDGNGLSHNKIVRITADGNLAVPGSEEILYECDQSFGTIHQGGDMVFGNDGKLYISTGDKGRGDMVQSLNSNLGKVLRINKDGSIPSDNPFFQVITGKYRAIYALGLRNPFSLAVQAETGRLFACDVGNASWEEINDIQAGKNYGWPLIEGKKTTQQAPVNYRDPLYAYDHNTGCSVVGAAFSPVTGGSFPGLYHGKFFFADYCKGYIKMLDPQTGTVVADFATGIDRPVAIAISPEGDFYYLARSGMGGGSEADNTESEQGSLWKVIYTGSEAPYVYQQPQSGLRVEGEDFFLQTKSLGKPPLHFRWQKNGSDLAVPDTNILTINMVSLTDSNAAFRCIVSNSLGQDTSAPAFLWVTTNQRPLPEILTPEPDFLYKAGTYIPFSGVAIDPETDTLPASKTYWKIDFHHDDHLHPVMTPTSNIVVDSIWIPTVGEPDDNVWYRLHFSAQDADGLSQTVTRDVFPLKTPVEIYCHEASVPVNADGFLGTTPYLFKSVAGLERSLSVPGFLDETDTVLIFRKWKNGYDKTFRTFITPDTGIFSARVEYDKIAKANGFGLLGEYFNEAMYPWGFDEALLLSRIDSTVNFEWAEGSPAPGYVPDDGFTVRWTGQIVPYSDDTLTFYTFTDDGVRLWVNDSLLIDHWGPQGGTEHAASLYLEGGKRYPIRMEFLEIGGVATAKLRWSTSRMPKGPIPQRQLYPPQQLIPNRLNGFVWLDADGDDEWDNIELPLAGAAVLVTESGTKTVVAAALTDDNGQYDFPAIPSGTYSILVLPPIQAGSVEPGYGLSQSGVSPEFDLAGEQHLDQNFAFRIALDAGNINSAIQTWEVSPNPTDGLLYFRKKLVAFQERFQIQVYNADGKLCLEKIIPENTWETELDLGSLASGIYIVRAGGQSVKITVF